jgi:hypothetical protein
MAPEPSPHRRVARWLIFAVICLIALAATGFLALRAARRARPPAAASAAGGVDAAALAAVMRNAHLLFQTTRTGQDYGHIAAASFDDPSGRRAASALSCERVDYAGGAGVCLAADRGLLTTYNAILFDARFERRGSIVLAGAPSRVRVSPDGSIAGITVFVSGHSYAAGNLSTQALLVDVRNGTPIAELEQFEVRRNGQPFKSADFNFWGITFSPDSNRFYATLQTGGVRYLVDGNVRARRLEVLREGIECPSLSPDSARIAFKKRIVEHGSLVWRLAVLDMATMSERVLPNETRSVDDQVEWADNSRILYGLPDGPDARSTSIWMMSVDGGAPVRLLDNAWSPSVDTSSLIAGPAR